MPFASTPYSPGGSPTNSNRPIALVLTSYFAWRASLVSTTVDAGYSACRFVGDRPAEGHKAALRGSHDCRGAEQQQEDRRAGAAGNRTTIAMHVQHGANSPFETRGTRHRRRGKPHLPALVQRARQLDEMRGVIGAFDAAAHHLVVACVLAFEPEAPAGEPEQRIEPVDRAQQLGRELHDPVAATDVRELVRQHDSRALVASRLQRRPAE